MGAESRGTSVHVGSNDTDFNVSAGSVFPSDRQVSVL
jgi:hypothetical protein